MEAGDRTVLIVDDDPTIRQLLVDTFGFEGYSVLSVEDGEGGLRLAEEQRPDLILLDLTLPRLSGLETLDRLKLSQVTATIPVVVMSGLDVPSREGQPPPDAVMLKPFDLDQLVTLVAGMVGKHEGRPSA